MRLGVAVEIHAHEGGELHEAGIDAPERTVIAEWHARDQVLLEPGHRLALGQFIDLGQVDAGVDRLCHQRHRSRLRRMIILRHDRRGHKRGNAGLTHRNDMGARPHRFQKLDQMGDVIVETEAARRQRNVTRVVPVGI